MAMRPFDERKATRARCATSLLAIQSAQPCGLMR
jgi:hypothetical protein